MRFADPSVARPGPAHGVTQPAVVQHSRRTLSIKPLSGTGEELEAKPKKRPSLASLFARLRSYFFSIAAFLFRVRAHSVSVTGTFQLVSLAWNKREMLWHPFQIFSVFFMLVFFAYGLKEKSSLEVAGDQILPSVK